MEKLREKQGLERSYQPMACWGIVKLPRVTVSLATKPDAAELGLWC